MPTLAQLVAAASARGTPPKGSTPAVRKQYHAVLVDGPHTYDPNTLGDSNPTLWAEPEVLGRIIAAEQQGIQPERSLLLFYHFESKAWNSTPGFLSWWSGANIGCVQWFDTTWFFEDTPSSINCVARFNIIAGP